MKTLQINKPLEILKPHPIDVRSYHESYNNALEYASYSAVAYEGQVISVKMDNGLISLFSLNSTDNEDSDVNYVLRPVGDHVTYSHVDTLPTEDIEDIIYILSSDNIGYIFNNEVWTPLIYPKKDTISEDEASTEALVSEKAVVDYVNQKISDAGEGNDSRYVTNVSYNKDTGDIEVVKPKSTSNFNLEGIVHTPSYDQNTRTFTFPIFGQEKPLTISLGKDIFIDPTKDNKYNPETGNIELYLNDGSIINIPARELIDVYTGYKSSTVNLEVLPDNSIRGELLVSTRSGNAIEVVPLDDENGETGLYVEYIDYQPRIDESINVSKKYTDNLRSDFQGRFDTMTDYITNQDINILEIAKKYTDTSLKDFSVTSSDSSIKLSFTTEENQKIFSLEEGQSYNTTYDSVFIYVNGIQVSNSVIIKKDSTTIELMKPLPAGYRITFEITQVDI